MNDIEILEGNKLIAEFMGSKVTEPNGQLELPVIHTFMPKKNSHLCYTSMYCMPEDLMYHMDWNWLMPVVEKIGNLQPVDSRRFDVKFQTRGSYVMIMHGYSLLIDIQSNSLLQATYKAVVEFVKWYNEQE